MQKLFSRVVHLLPAIFTTLGATMTFLNSIISYFPLIKKFGVTSDDIQYCGLLLFMAGVILYMFVSFIENSIKEPNIKFREPCFTTDIFPFWQPNLFDGDAYPNVSFGGIEMLRIEISNMPKNPSGDNHARHVNATITYYDSKGKRLGKSRRGKWTSGKNPKSLNHVSDVSSIDIDSNGEPQILDIAVYMSSFLDLKDDKKVVYLLNWETMFLESGKGNEKDFRLDEIETTAHIKLLGYRIKEERWLRFSFKNKTHELLKRRPKNISRKH